jgi:molecular chaperone HtpG
LLTDRIDEWTVGHLGEFEGKSFRDVTRGDLDLEDLDDPEQKKAREEEANQHRDLLDKLAKVLESQVQSVRASVRLTQSPACLVVAAGDPGAHMRRLMELTGQDLPEMKPILEVNPGHPLVARLESEADEDRFSDLANLLFEQACLAEGGKLEDPAGFVKRLNRLLLDIST